MYKIFYYLAFFYYRVASTGVLEWDQLSIGMYDTIQKN